MTPDWLQLDHDHLWHPYSAVGSDAEVWPVTGARGVEIELADGRRLVDGMASWWSVIHGYNHPVLNEAVHSQVDRLAHVMFGGLTHEPAARLGARLAELAPGDLQHVFFADSGSVAVEVAIKMALQCQVGRGRPERHRLMTVRGGYHGDTFGAMSVCDPVNGMHRMFNGILAEQHFVDAPLPGDDPGSDADVQAVAAALERHAGTTAAFIIEPLVQGAGGMRFYRPGYLRAVAELCRQHEVLLILDEIATGFGRTGTLFAAEQANVAPDILCLGKALTGGYMTLAATLVTPAVSRAIRATKPGVLMHGPTFMANPLACSVARASIELLLSGDWSERVQAMERQLADELAPCRGLDCVHDVRVKGAIGVVQMADPALLAGMQREFVDAGVWVRPFRDLVYVMPPFVTTADQLSKITAAVCRVVAARSRGRGSAAREMLA